MAESVVTQADLFEAVEVVLVGKEKKDRIMSQKERRIVSYHEVGHALVNCTAERCRAGTEDHDRADEPWVHLVMSCRRRRKRSILNTKDELEAMLVDIIWQDVQQRKLVFDTVTTGASNDIEQATKIARAMVTQYGMSEKFGLIGLESVQNQLSGWTVR